MTNREKVIKGLEMIRETRGCPDAYYMDCKSCVYNDDPHCVDSILGDAISLLKAQEPRVMTLEEVITHYSLPPVFVDDLGAQEDYYEDIQPLYFEFLHDKEYPWMVHWIGHTQVTMCLNEWKHTYNKKWRCWTSRPTDAQREATPWKE